MAITTLTNKNRRKYDQLTNEKIQCYVPPPKKRKIHELSNSISQSRKISSLIFQHPEDHKQFEQMFTNINESGLIKSFNVTYFISKEIAEFAAGHCKNCANAKCKNQVTVLFQDKDTPDYAWDYQTIYGISSFQYKQCPISKKYFCSNCMTQLGTCSECECESCEALKFIPNYDKCSNCKTTIFDCDCWHCDFGNCECSYQDGCYACKLIACAECSNISECKGCGNRFCLDCCEHPTEWQDLPSYGGYCVCKTCYHTGEMECIECGTVCPLLFKSNDKLIKSDWYGNVDMMVMCSIKECDTYICLGLDHEKEDRRGTRIVCAEEWCNRYIYFCDVHTNNDVVKCGRHD